MYTVYILRTADNKLYIGQTKDLESRLHRHLKLQGALYLKAHRDFWLVYTEEYTTLQAATCCEKQLKGWRRAKKEALIQNDVNLLKEL